MKRIFVIPVAASLITSGALAAPFKDTLTTKERDAIVEAVRAAIPPRDKVAEAKCQPSLDAYNAGPIRDFEKAFDAASCFRAAGSTGIAIVLWRLYVRDGVDLAKKRAAILTLAIENERIAAFAEAATYGERYASEFEHATDAPERLTRAMCIRRQLGHANEATHDAKRLATVHNVVVDPERSCEGVRPIKMPVTKP